MNNFTAKQAYAISRQAGAGVLESLLIYAIPTGIGNFFKKLGPEIIVDKDKRIVTIESEGSCGYHLTETYYTLKGYKIIDNTK